MTILDRETSCPSCGAPVRFAFAGARAVVCGHCRFVVARTDRGLEAVGRMADLLAIPTPLQVGVDGRWRGNAFVVEGRVQMDRTDAPSAPWQEILLSLPELGQLWWIAYAQGRWYLTKEEPAPPGGLPPVDALRPGMQLDLGPHGLWVVQEVGGRRVVSGEGSLPNVPAPGALTRYADISGPKGRFGTLDYGDGRAPPTLFLGGLVDPRELTLSSGAPLEAPKAQAAAMECPNCGGNLPMLTGLAERVVCQYCGTASDVTGGKLAALGPLPRPPVEPAIALGAQGRLHDEPVLCVGFMVRACWVEGERYAWREYLLFVPPSAGAERTAAVGGAFRWLMEEDGKWQWVKPLEVGDVRDHGQAVELDGAVYRWKQQVTAVTEHVVGEFYWKVEQGEQVEATEFQGAAGIVSRERAPTEVVYSLCTRMRWRDIAAGFGLPVGAAPPGGGQAGRAVLGVVFIVIILAVIVVAATTMDGCAVGGFFFGGGGGK
ncbi:MAG: DUF4178 domain-containing protein [Polyangiaceae bacterium]|nr:DUF4178 domain-containing protein [Polyangiaceae bacterium]